jgi:hypothetical protein
MILQIINILAGFLLALPGLKERGAQEWLTTIEAKSAPWKDTLGLLTLVVGIIGLLDRIHLIPWFIPELGSSFPQAIPAILTGALLALPKLERYPVIAAQIKRFTPHVFPLGLLGVAVGLGSLLFGCVVPVFCRLPF